MHEYACTHAHGKWEMQATEKPVSVVQRWPLTCSPQDFSPMFVISHMEKSGRILFHGL